MKNIDRFSNRVENYIQYRPHYPQEIISYLKNEINLTSEMLIADIGSGTGISSEIFLSNGNTVYAVEPNTEMRKGAENIFKNNEKFVSLNATAEHTSLPDNSIDLIVSGQSFHWFDRTHAKKEFLRIAKPDVSLVLLWNDFTKDSGFQEAYENMLKKYGTDYEKVNFRTVDENIIASFYSPFSYSMQTFHHSQTFDFEGIKGRLLSSSYVPLETDPTYLPMIDCLKELFDKYSIDGKINFEYACKLYCGKLKY